jgi:hemolysin activation/secretion protein/AraC-like DNA-binding protein
MKCPSQLLLEEIPLGAGQEWWVSSPAWHLVRLHSGPAYWLGGTEPRVLTEGDVILAGPGSNGCVRASRLGDVQLHAFAFAPRQLGGLLSLAEQRFFAEHERCAGASARVLPADHPAVGAFAALLGRGGLRPSLALRGELLEIVGAIFDTELARHQSVPAYTTPACRRFHELIVRMPETELVQHHPQELARLCGCTVRHFGRLFRDAFGAPPRTRQTELRLRRASQLLLETDSKVIDVAFESGYRNLSLFNALFKRQYKMTPTAWRRKNLGGLKKQARAAAAALLLLAAPWLLQPAQSAEATARPQAAEGTNSPPVATSTNRPPEGAKPAAERQAPVTFEVKGYELEGNTLLPGAVTQPILQKHTGNAVTFEGVRQALADLQMAYRERGFITVAVALPPQQLTNGIVHVLVTEGRLSAIRIHGNRYFSDANVRRALPDLHTNMILNSLAFQQELDRANANRDRQIYGNINPGDEPGTTALDLNVKDRLPLHERMDVDNYSTPGTPALRINAAAQYNNLWQLEHQLGVQYSFSPQAYKQGSYPFYDLPLIANYSAFYRMPLGAVNGPPHPQDYSVGDFGYDEVTRRFRPPPAQDSSELLFYASRSSIDTGNVLQSQTLTPPVIPPEGALQVKDQIYSQSISDNSDVGARWSLPLPMMSKVRSSLSVGPDYKNYRIDSAQNRTFSATIFVPENGQTGPPFTEFHSPPTSTSRSIFNSVEYLPLTLLWEGGFGDNWGSTSFSLNQSANYGDLLANAKNFEALASSTKANGDYYIIQPSLTREQKLPSDYGLRLHADGQWANQPLISNEQFALGGLAGVRGYQDGQLYGDTGWRVQFEPHTPLATVGVVNGVPITARLFAFADYGQLYLIDPGTRPGRIQELGWGGGLDSSIGAHVDFRVTIGVPALDVPGRNAGEARAYFTLAAQF